MKKFLAKILSAALAALCIFSVSACAKDTTEGDGNNTPPANKLYLSGSLQQLYGGEEGYPQAVIVAKKSFTAQYPEWTNGFIAKLNNAETYLKTAESSTIINALASKLTDGETPAFNAKNLSAATVKNCNVKFVAASAEKEAVRAVLTGMMGANAPQTSDEFFYTPAEAQADEVAPEIISITSPDGAPALALVQMIEEGDNIVDFKIVNANTITTYVTNTDDTKNSDFCIMPVNAAAKLLGNGEKYQMLGTVTHGNLFMVSSNAEAQYTNKEQLQTLIGKTVGVIQIANVPGMVFKMILNKYEIPFTVISGGDEPAADKVNLAGITDAAQVTPDGDYSAYVIAEPLVSLRTK